jgi:uroporphyrinogen-III synthase
VRLLVTRPERDGERTAQALRDSGHEVVLAALMRIEPIANVEFGEGPWSGLVMTSANALPAVTAHARRAELTRLPLCVVGERSAEAARAAGFGDVRCVGRDVGELIQDIRGSLQRGADPLLYLAGEETSRDLAGDLMADGFATRTVVVYRAVKAERLPSSAESALAACEIDGVLHFSRRSAEAFIACARAGGMLDRALAPPHYCLSQQVAGPLKAAGAGDVRIAARPEEAALIALIDAKP